MSDLDLLRSRLAIAIKQDFGPNVKVLDLRDNSEALVRPSRGKPGKATITVPKEYFNESEDTRQLNEGPSKMFLVCIRE